MVVVSMPAASHRLSGANRNRATTRRTGGAVFSLRDWQNSSIIFFPVEDSPLDISLFFAVLGGLLVLAFVANRLVRFTRVPDVLILMATGVLIWPVLHWVNPDIFRGAARGF